MNVADALETKRFTDGECIIKQVTHSTPSHFNVNILYVEDLSPFAIVKTGLNLFYMTFCQS